MRITPPGKQNAKAGPHLDYISVFSILWFSVRCFLWFSEWFSVLVAVEIHIRIHVHFWTFFVSVDKWAPLQLSVPPGCNLYLRHCFLTVSARLFQALLTSLLSQTYTPSYLFVTCGPSPGYCVDAFSASQKCRNEKCLCCPFSCWWRPQRCF